MSTNKQALRDKIQLKREILDTQTVIDIDELEALLDELESAQNRSVELPSFDGYVPHIAKELQAAFKIACAAAGITVKGE